MKSINLWHQIYEHQIQIIERESTSVVEIQLQKNELKHVLMEETKENKVVALTNGFDYLLDVHNSHE